MTVTRAGRFLLCALLAFGVQLAQAQAPTAAPKQVPADEWAPSDADKQTVQALGARWLALKDAGQGKEAWDFFSPAFREKVAFADWNARLVKFNAMAGPVRERRLVRITWFNDPPQAPAPGTYAALEYHNAFERIPQHLENVILHRPPGAGFFSVLRNEVDFAPPKPAAGSPKKK